MLRWHLKQGVGKDFRNHSRLKKRKKEVIIRERNFRIFEFWMVTINRENINKGYNLPNAYLMSDNRLSTFHILSLIILSLSYINGQPC